MQSKDRVKKPIIVLVDIEYSYKLEKLAIALDEKKTSLVKQALNKLFDKHKEALYDD